MRHLSKSLFLLWDGWFWEGLVAIKKVLGKWKRLLEPCFQHFLRYVGRKWWTNCCLGIDWMRYVYRPFGMNEFIDLNWYILGSIERIFFKDKFWSGTLAKECQRESGILLGFLAKLRALPLKLPQFWNVDW
jgi:hypothetical protein